ncbi:MAG: OmpA family protein [Deltaproteobacteria bacterium]|nr:OmpA family protein [Deltaproteobacteria bacterium]
MKRGISSTNSSLALTGNTQPAWLLTFSDLLTLLLTFFVVRYALIHQAPEEVRKSLSLVLNSNFREAGTRGNDSLPASISGSALEINEDIFQLGQSTLNFENTIKVRSIAKALVARKAKSIIIYAETSANKGNNWDLAKERALVIYRQFIDAGVERKSISLSFYDLTLADNKSLPVIADYHRGELKIMVKGLQ